MKLWIIGNGFDLHHELETRYADYKAFLCRCNACRLVKEWRAARPQKHDEVCENGCDFGHRDCPVKKFNALPRLQEPKEDLWRDLEEACDFDLKALMYTFKGDYRASGELRSGESAALSLLDDSLCFAKAFTGQWFDKWLREIDASLRKDVSEKKIDKKNLGIGADDRFLTFNYTSTLEAVYGVSDNKVYWVHGRLKSVDDKLEEEKDEIKRMTSKDSVAHECLMFGSPEITDASVQEAIDYFTTLQKMSADQVDAFSRRTKMLMGFLKKNVQCRLNSMVEWVAKNCVGESSPDEVVVAGHSLGRYDSLYFEFLAGFFKNKKWRFLIHNKDDLVRAYDFCEEHGLHGRYVRWDDAESDNTLSLADCDVLHSGGASNCETSSRAAEDVRPYQCR